MAITLKKKPAVVEDAVDLDYEAPVAAPADELGPLIDKVGRLADEAEAITKRIKAEQAKLKPYKDALAELQEKVDALTLGDDEKVERKGAAFFATVGVRGTSREVTDLAKARKLLGDKVFMECATVKLGDLDKYLTPPELAQVIKSTRGSRSLKIERLG